MSVHARGSPRGEGVTQLVLSLFPGIGLLDMAFEAEGYCVVRGPDKIRAVGNGVPLPLGRAVARAIRRAVEFA